jgi:hypothetical protein
MYRQQALRRAFRRLRARVSLPENLIFPFPCLLLKRQTRFALFHEHPAAMTVGLTKYS